LWQWLGTNGDPTGTSSIARRTLLYGYAVAAVACPAAATLNLITTRREEPQYGLVAPIVWQASSLLTFLLFFWIVWIGYRIAPPWVRPRWKLVVHVPAALVFSLAHVGGFVVLRKLAYSLEGARYAFGSFLPNFGYELSKDVVSYALFIGTFALVERLLCRQSLIDTSGAASTATKAQTPTFDIRDGARLTRVRLDQVLAIRSAGNYVQFMLTDGRQLLMRSPLSAVERELGPRGFLRTHRSWLVNAGQVTSLKPEGSGDYAVDLGGVTVPLSRRFPQALAKLRGGQVRPG
jgi:hypothetical protein